MSKVCNEYMLIFFIFIVLDNDNINNNFIDYIFKS